MLSKIPRSTLADLRRSLPEMREVRPGYWTLDPMPETIDFAQSVITRVNKGI